MPRSRSLEHVAPMVADPRSLAAQLADRIRQAIVDGTFGRGEQLPSEERLCEVFRVGRTTVREALKELQSEGVVQVRRGRGRFVSSLPPVQRPITRLESVTDMLAAQGYTVVNRLLAQYTRRASADERANLRLGPEDDVVHLERLRLAQGEPLIYSVDVVPAQLLGPAGDKEWEGSLFVALERLGLTPTASVSTFRASLLPPAAQQACGLDPSLPWLLMVQLNLTDEGIPVIFSHDYHRGDRFSFEVLRRAEPRGGHRE
ncbi:MAG TPA: GntR family transcriptional regulator [Actinomycetes bacterium]|nr:GntR family transcriptional regulator [Actinomycetes bacterium]